MSPACGLRSWLLTAALATASAAVLAQAGADCVPAGTQEQVNACAVRDFQAADTDLGAVYSAVMQTLSGGARLQLRREHSAWVHDRNAGCKQATRAFEQQVDGPRRYHECLTHTTQARRQALMRGQPARP